MRLYISILLLTHLCSGASSGIVEIRELVDTKKYVDPKTLLILDLDETLVLKNGLPTEPNVSHLFDELAISVDRTISITARPQTSGKYSYKQMQRLGMFFNDDFKMKSNVFNCGWLLPCQYHKGIISSGNASKGKALQAFLKNAKYNPKRIVFVDNLRENLESVGKLAKKRGIDYVGLWYTKYMH